MLYTYMCARSFVTFTFYFVFFVRFFFVRVVGICICIGIVCLEKSAFDRLDFYSFDILFGSLLSFPPTNTNRNQFHFIFKSRVLYIIYRHVFFFVLFLPRYQNVNRKIISVFRGYYAFVLFFSFFLSCFDLLIKRFAYITGQFD